MDQSIETSFLQLSNSLSPAWLAVLISGIALVLLLLLLSRQSRHGAERFDALLKEEHRQLREAATRDAWELRDEIATAQSNANQMLVTSVAELGRSQGDGLGAMEQRMQHLIERGDLQQERLRESLERRIAALQSSNDVRIGQIRELVEEKLQNTLERRLGESFRQVSERLEAVQKGLGEMQTLATGVGDLKRVLTNVKARGTWGEVQLGALLEEILTPDQYASNVQTRKGSSNVVEYAVRLPGDDGEGIWLPIDAKFPMEDYQRLLVAIDAADQAGTESSLGALIRSLKSSARDIAEKYLDPPNTTDFAILFLPTEGLYSEVLRQPGIVEILQREFRIVVAGPTTLAAILNSLRMGFRTLAIEQRSSEVWSLLAAVKTEFDRFGALLEKLKKQLDSAAHTIDQTGTRTRAMARKLRQVEQMPETEMHQVLDLDEES